MTIFSAYAGEINALILLTQQLGLAFIGAASLWGLFFFFNSKSKEHSEAENAACELISGKLFFAFILGCIFAFPAWVIKSGTSLSFVQQSRVRAFLALSSGSQGILNIITTLWFFLFVLMLGGIFLYRRYREYFLKNINVFYVIAFITSLILISFPTGIEKYDIDRLFFIYHGFPLIFTIGTVTVTDFVFFFTRSSLRLKRIIYPFLSTLHKMVWLGLGITFLWQWTALDPSAINTQFYFVQTIIGLMIINGMLFTGPLMHKLEDGVSERHVKPLEDKWIAISEISGVITFSCWTSVSYLAYFTDLQFSYQFLMAFFIVKTMFVYFLLKFIEWVTDKPMSLVGTH